jgi:hypothetical protein
MNTATDNQPKQAARYGVALIDREKQKVISPCRWDDWDDAAAFGESEVTEGRAIGFQIVHDEPSVMSTSCTCYAFQENSGAIDIESVAASPEQVRAQMLQACLGWRFEYPDRYSHDETWAAMLKTGTVVKVVVAPLESHCSDSVGRVPNVEIHWSETNNGEITGTVGGCLVGILSRDTGCNPYLGKRLGATWSWKSNNGLIQQALVAVVRKQNELNKLEANAA